MKNYLTLCLTLLLSACVSDALQSSTPPVMRYVVHPAKLDSSFADERIVKVEKVKMAEVLQTDQIVLLEANRRIHYLESAHWAAPLPELLQGFIVDSLSTAHNLTVITSDDARIEADYRLKLSISDAYALYDVAGQGAPTIYTKGKYMLLDARTNAIIDVIAFDERLPAKDNSATAITEAFEAQWQGVAVRIADNLKR